MPFFSVIVATRNVSPCLGDCLESLGAQTFRDFEVVIQDALSDDGTLAVAEAMRATLPRLHVESARDTGLYDAWNKAVVRASGEWVLFLGADDRLVDATVLADMATCARNVADDVEYISGSVLRVDAAGDDVALDAADPRTVMARMPGCMALPHPGLFHRRRLFVANAFDTSFRIAGDYDFLARTLRPHNFICVGRPVTRMRVGGMSGNVLGLWDSEVECLRASRRHYPDAVPWLLLFRLCRSGVFRLCSRVLPRSWLPYLADGYRVLTGRRPLWTKMEGPRP